MNNIFNYVCKNGLKVIFIKKPGFVKKYCGIGTYYGAANMDFIYNGKKYTSPQGIAHFLEHKLFRMPDGSDASALFSKLKAEGNAYTSSDKTLYFFETNADVYKPLDLLINMYFTPVFMPDDVENEKSIITQELHMYQADLQYRLSVKAIEIAYPNDNYSKEILGTEESINSTTPEDLQLAYDAFYTPQNSHLVVVGDLDENELFSFIENEVKNYKARKTGIKLKTIKSKKTAKSLVYTDKTPQDLLYMTLRMPDVSNEDPIACDMLVGVLDNFLSVSSPFYQELDKKKLFDGDIDYQISTLKDTSEANIYAASKKPEALARAISNKIKKLDSLDKELVDLYLKLVKARSINGLDDVVRLGDTVLNNIVEGNDYFKYTEEIINAKCEDLNKYLEYIRTSQISFVICKKDA